MFVAESYTGKKGEYVKLIESLDGIEQILDGKMDERPEEEFYMMGAIR
jgi:F-type H+-transporting ATPase subunit beta